MAIKECLRSNCEIAEKGLVDKTVTVLCCLRSTLTFLQIL